MSNPIEHVRAACMDFPDERRGDVLEAMHRRDGFAPFRRLGGRVPIALDGTEYVRSQKLGCPRCQTRERSNGKRESDRSRLCATVVAPGHAMARPPMPDFIAPQDGAEKRDRERNAVRRWLATHAHRVGDLRPIFLGDDLFACQPVADAMVVAGGDFLLTAEPNGDHLEHDFSHSKQNLAMMSAALNMLAFAIHTVCDCLERIWVDARTAKRARHRFFEHIRTITAYLVFPEWNTLVQTLVDSKPPPEIEAQIAR